MRPVYKSPFKKNIRIDRLLYWWMLGLVLGCSSAEFGSDTNKIKSKKSNNQNAEKTIVGVPEENSVKKGSPVATPVRSSSPVPSVEPDEDFPENSPNPESQPKSTPSIIPTPSPTIEAGCINPELYEVAQKNGDWPRDLRIDGENLVWLNWRGNGDLNLVPRTGGTVIQLATDLYFPVTLRADENNFYVGQSLNATKTISVVPRDGSAVHNLAAQNVPILWDPRFIDIDQNRVYWANAAGIAPIASMPKSGEFPMQTIVTPSDGYNTQIMIVDADFVYYLEWKIHAQGEEYATRLLKVSKSGGESTLLATFTSYADMLSQNSTHLFLAKYSPSSIVSIPKTGGGVSTIKTLVDRMTINALKVNDEAVFYSAQFSDVPSQNLLVRINLGDHKETNFLKEGQVQATITTIAVDTCVYFGAVDGFIRRVGQ